jgi:hypothetical protein
MTRFALTLALVLAFAVSGFAQTTTTSTTLSAAVNGTASLITVASATSFVEGSTYAFVDDELMEVSAVSGTSITVMRGANGTRVMPHLTGSTVYVGPFNVYRASDPSGSCTSTNETYLPQINPATGGVWDCSAKANLWWNVRKALNVTCRTLLVADSVDQACFVADRPYAVVKVTEIHTTPESAGTLTIIPKKATGTQAIASGTALTAAAIDMVTATAQTLITPTLSATPAALQLAAGNRLGLDFTDDVAGELVGVIVTFTLWPR